MTQRLQAEFARRREAEHVRIEKNNAVNRYFDHWGKITSRFESWTAPKYYEHAEESLRKTREKELKDKQLQERQEKLKALFECESKEYEEELRLLKRPRSRRISTDVLQKIDKNLKEREEERRRLQLESKLYSRLRYGTSDDSALFESKTDHQVLAKLNWLDKQIENQIHKEQEEKETQIRNLRLEEEARKREEYLKEREKIRESEIKELRAMQETHMTELKRREKESSDLQIREQHLRRYIDEINEIENDLITISERKLDKTLVKPTSYNWNRIKMITRQRIEIVRNELREFINILKRLSVFISDESIMHLIEKFEMQYDFEIQRQSQIEVMYESEAKHNLEKWEEIWTQESEARDFQIQNLLKKEMKILEHKLDENIKQQKRLIEVQETHLAAIENSNDKFRFLIDEEDKSSKQIDNYCEKSNEENGIATELSRCEIRQDSPVPPKFGKKKIAWT